MTLTTRTTIHLHATDNVVVCTQTLEKGTEILLMDTTVALEITVGIGHKLACRDIAAGELIVKYGVPIGTATAAIPLGSHVHTHNIKSNYIPTYLLEE